MQQTGAVKLAEIAQLASPAPPRRRLALRWYWAKSVAAPGW